MINYETDIVVSTNQQAWLMRNKKFNLLDLDDIADEIEDVGKRKQRELANRMAVLLQHLLKWQYQPAQEGTSWHLAIKTQRERIRRCLRQTPSLKNFLKDEDWWEDVWADACYEVEKETSITFDKLPWTIEEILADDWFPKFSV